MPNWCRGVLKIRGKKKNLLNFLKNGMEVTYYTTEKENLILKSKLLKINNESCETIVSLQENKDNIYIKDTRRAFVVDGIYWDWNSDDKEDLEENYTKLIDIQQAWRLEVEQFSNISRKYNLDIRIKGYESGMQFAQEFIIVKGNIVSYKEFTYDDYIWEVDDPRLGG